MLRRLRGSLSGTFSYLFVGLVILAFGLAGLGGLFVELGETKVVSLGSLSYQEQEFLAAYQQAQDRQVQIFGRSFTPEERDRAVDAIVEQASLRLAFETEALEQGLDFGFGGSVGISPSERQERFTRGAGALNAIFSDVLTVGDGLDALIARHVEEVRDFDAMVFDAEAAREGISVSLSDLRAYFEKNSEDYDLDEERVAGLIEISDSTIGERISVDEVRIDEKFALDPTRYDSPQTREIFQFSFDDRQTAQSARAWLDSDRSVEELAETLGLGESAYDLGFVARSEVILDEVGEAVFSLEEQGVSEVIDTGIGFVVAKVNAIRQARTLDEDEVKRRLREEERSAVLSDFLYDVNKAADNLFIADETFETVAQTLGIELQTVVLLADGTDGKRERVPLPDGRALVSELFAAEIGVEAVPHTYRDRRAEADSYVWYEVRQIREPRERSYEEVGDLVREDFLDAETATRLGADLSSLALEIGEGADFDRLAEDRELEVVSKGDVKRNGDRDFNRTMMASVFRTKVGDLVSAVNDRTGNHYLVKVTGARVPQRGSDQIDTVRDRLRTAYATRAREAYYATLEEKYAVSVNRDVVETAIISEGL